MNAIELRKIVTREVGNMLLPIGYSQVKVKADMVASYEKNDGKYYYEFHCHTEKYNEYKLVYAFSLGVNKIVEILKEIDSHVPLSRRIYTVQESITGISPGQLLNPLDISRAYKYFATEEALLSILQEVKTFYEQNFVPFCNKYSNVEELDKLINSSADFWIDSTGKTTPISFFHITRLIIARLANNGNFDEVVERNFQALEELWKRDGGVFDRNDGSKAEVFAAKFLKEKSFA